MKNMKQALFVVFAVALVAAPLVVGAAISDPQYPGAATVSNASEEGANAGLTNTTVFELVSNAMNWLLGIIGVLAVIAFVVSGVMYLTSAGDEGQVEKAKGIMIYAIIGLVVAFVGLIIVNAVAGLTGAGGGDAFDY